MVANEKRNIEARGTCRRRGRLRLHSLCHQKDLLMDGCIERQKHMELRVGDAVNEYGDTGTCFDADSDE